jgi:hypothetical protein
MLVVSIVYIREILIFNKSGRGGIALGCRNVIQQRGAQGAQQVSILRKY